MSDSAGFLLMQEFDEHGAERDTESLVRNSHGPDPSKSNTLVAPQAYTPCGFGPFQGVATRTPNGELPAALPGADATSYPCSAAKRGGNTANSNELKEDNVALLKSMFKDNLDDATTIQVRLKML
jgi:hypothetical protein